MKRENLDTLIGNPAILKQVNKVRILNRLRLVGTMSRAELARVTGLDAKTVTNICNALLEEGLLDCTQARAEGRGRPPENIAIRGDAAFSVGIDIGATQVSAALIDLSGKIIKQTRWDFGKCQDGNFLIGKAADAVKEVTGSISDKNKKKVSGLGVCIPGFLDRSAGIVCESVNIANIKYFPIGEILKKSTGLQVLLEEASRSMAIGEIWFGQHWKDSDFICVDIGFGVGVGIVHDGLLYRGAHEGSGEIGHTVVVNGGNKCSCGKQGCLETVVSGFALEEKAKMLGFLSKNSSGGKTLFDAAQSGNPEAKKELNKAGFYIGLAIANMINLFDPSLIVLNGGLIKAGDYILESLKNSIRENSIGRNGAVCKIEVSDLGDYAGALGAAMLGLKHFFEFKNIKL